VEWIKQMQNNNPPGCLAMQGHCWMKQVFTKIIKEQFKGGSDAR